MTPQNITPKQLELLILIYKYRFLNRIQLQQFIKHKDTKRINIWLTDLYKKNILGRYYLKTFKDNTKPAIYYLKTKSKAYLENLEFIDQQSLKRVYTEKLRSQKFIDHCILLGNLFLNLQTSLTTEKLHFFTKTDLAKHDNLPESKPDAYIAIENGTSVLRYFLEIIDLGTPRFKIRSKINLYFYYLDSNEWQTHTGHEFPKLLLLCPNKTIEDYLHKYIPQVLDEHESSIQIFISQGLPANWVLAGTKMASENF